jgi:hypothetical protein
LVQLCPALKPLEEGVVNNGDRWQAVADRGTHSEEEEEEKEELGEEGVKEDEEEEEEERQDADESPERNKAARNL